MLLAVNVGNTHIRMGLFEGHDLRNTWTIRTDPHRTSDEYAMLVTGMLRDAGVADCVDAAVCASVVPPLTQAVCEAIGRLIPDEPLLVHGGLTTGISIRTEHPEELGADLLANSVAAYHTYRGHTIVVDGIVLKLHLIPSGILYPDTICLIGSGTVVDPKVMLGELDMLAGHGIDVSGLKLASTAHVTMPYHRLLDLAMEERRGDRRIGTTGRGIGPTYADKSERNGIRGGPA